MMWNAVINILSIGARIILYDGSPFAPSLKTFLKIVSDQKYVISLPTLFLDLTPYPLFSVTVFGTGPRFLAEVKGQGIDPRQWSAQPTLILHPQNQHQS